VPGDSPIRDRRGDVVALATQRRGSDFAIEQIRVARAQLLRTASISICPEIQAVAE
jgi:hypothetical protein